MSSCIDLMTMRRSPRRPLILRRRKLPFLQNDPPAAESQSRTDAANLQESKSAANQCFPDGIRILDHPSMSDTRVVLIPKPADLHSVIGALTAKGKESGTKGPNKFILLSGNDGPDGGSDGHFGAGGDNIAKVRKPAEPGSVHSSPDAKRFTGIKALECGPMDDSLTNIQWLGQMNTCALEADPGNQIADKENQASNSQTFKVENAPVDTAAGQQPMAERPPYSYMAMIQFAINSRKSRMMTLKDIYTWIEDHFPYFRDVAKPGWKNSIRHNLSLHDMFIRETSPDGKVSFWTISPEANRRLTLDQVYKSDCDQITAPVPVPMLLFPQQQRRRMLPDTNKMQSSSERRMKPLLPRTESYLVPIQLPVASSVYLPSSSASFLLSGPQQKRNIARGTKRVRIAPKVTQSDKPAAVMYPQKAKGKEVKVEIKEEQVCVPVHCKTPEAPKRQSSSSRRKQRLVHSVHEEPVLLCPDNTFFDSGVASDASAFQDMHDAEQDEQQEQHSPDRDFSFKTPIKNSSHLTSSTPSKPPSHVMPEPWKVTPVGKGSQSVLDFSPIRTPDGLAVTPHHDYNTLCYSSPPFKDGALFGSPRELLTSAQSRPNGPADSTAECLQLNAEGAATPTNRSVTEGLILDVMNDSLSKILVDISFSGLDDDDLGMANISWSEFIPQFK